MCLCVSEHLGAHATVAGSNAICVCRLGTRVNAGLGAASGGTWYIGWNILAPALKIARPLWCAAIRAYFDTPPIGWVQVKLVLAHGAAGAFIVAFVAVIFFVLTHRLLAL